MQIQAHEMTWCVSKGMRRTGSADCLPGLQHSPIARTSSCGSIGGTRSITRSDSFKTILESVNDNLSPLHNFMSAAAVGGKMVKSKLGKDATLFTGIESAICDVVTAENARVGLLVTLNLKEFKGPRLPGDTGAGCLFEDHFGDGLSWRVRWIQTNTWNVYLTGDGGEHDLLLGTAQAEPWDSDCFLRKGRMPSFFFCTPLALTREDRAVVYDASSPRSRIFLPKEEDMI
jgi:hypothetical protein